MYGLDPTPAIVAVTVPAALDTRVTVSDRLSAVHTESASSERPIGPSPTAMLGPRVWVPLSKRRIECVPGLDSQTPEASTATAMLSPAPANSCTALVSASIRAMRDVLWMAAQTE